MGTTAPALKRTRADGKPMFWRAHPGLAKGKVRHVGDPVACVVAETWAQAKDAAEKVEVDYEDLPLTQPVWDEGPAWTGRILADRAHRWGWEPKVSLEDALAELEAGLR